jgi:hypothetical protein
MGWTLQVPMAAASHTISTAVRRYDSRQEQQSKRTGNLEGKHVEESEAKAEEGTREIRLKERARACDVIKCPTLNNIIGGLGELHLPGQPLLLFFSPGNKHLTRTIKLFSPLQPHSKYLPHL